MTATKMATIKTVMNHDNHSHKTENDGHKKSRPQAVTVTAIRQTMTATKMMATSCDNDGRIVMSTKADSH